MMAKKVSSPLALFILQLMTRGFITQCDASNETPPSTHHLLARIVTPMEPREEWDFRQAASGSSTIGNEDGGVLQDDLSLSGRDLLPKINTLQEEAEDHQEEEDDDDISNLSLHLLGLERIRSQQRQGVIRQTTPSTTISSDTRKNNHNYQHHTTNSPPSSFAMSAKKTGTTIAGCIVDSHVILCADSRATEGTYVADKRCQKLHPLSMNCWCAGAGTSADLDHLTDHCLHVMALDALRASTCGNANQEGASKLATLPTINEETGCPLLLGRVPIESICHFLQNALWKGRGKIGANLILGGVDHNHKDGGGGTPYLRALHPHGSMDIDLPFAALGSGGLNAMAILERDYRSNMTLAEGQQLVQEAIVAGIKNDLGSGSQVDMVVIAPDGTSTLQRCVVQEQEVRTSRSNDEDSDDNNDNRAIIDRDVGSGVNGFGNVPFAFARKSIKTVSDRTGATDKKAAWDKLLGI